MWLKNETLRLRALEESDLNMLYDWENDSNNWLYTSTLMPYSKHTLLEYIRNCQTDIFALETLKLVIELTDGTAVGTLDVFNIDHFNGRAELGVFVDSKYRGHGYATVAYNLFKDYAFKYLGWVNLYSIIPQKNSPMHNAAIRAGFSKTATLEKWIKTPQGYEDADIYTCIN
jgi:diamine N-acetyltransferase